MAAGDGLSSWQVLAGCSSAVKVRGTCGLMDAVEPYGENFLFKDRRHVDFRGQLVCFG